MNNQTIKFRAFDLRPGCRGMIDNIQDACGFRGPSFGEYLAYPNTYAVMQFTGLHDKNGKEIYEGDVLYQFDFPTEQYLAKFINESWAGSYRCYNVKKGWNFGGIVSDYLVIMGNIYENPELLKQND